LRQREWHRLFGLAEPVGDGDPVLLYAALFDRIHSDAAHQDFDQPALLLPRDRLVEPFSEIRQEGLRGADVPGDGVGTRNSAAQLGNLRLQPRLCSL